MLQLPPSTLRSSGTKQQVILTHTHSHNKQAKRKKKKKERELYNTHEGKASGKKDSQQEGNRVPGCVLAHALAIFSLKLFLQHLNDVDRGKSDLNNERATQCNGEGKV